MKNLQNKNLQYNKKFYNEEAHKFEYQEEDIKLLQEDEIDDPRHLTDIEKENMDLKEQMIHQMMTLEQYLSVAYMWVEEQEPDYNPYDAPDFDAPVENQSMNVSQSFPDFNDYKEDYQKRNEREEEEYHKDRVKKEFFENNPGTELS